MANGDSDAEEPEKIPSAPDFCLSIPLYRQFRFSPKGSHPLFSLEFFEGTMDCYCHGCGRHSVFASKKRDYYTHEGDYTDHIFALSFTCSRDSQHKLVFVFRGHQGKVEKIGQYPSLADLTTPDLQKYRPALGDDKYRELIRGVRLASHDVGIGAFTYLRRVFEYLIENAHTKAQVREDWDEALFQQSRMDERIQLLSSFLPEFLVENRALYRILSTGIHTLTEQECLEAFPVVLLGIELILDVELERMEREKKIEAARKVISLVARDLKQPKA